MASTFGPKTVLVLPFFSLVLMCSFARIFFIKPAKSLNKNSTRKDHNQTTFDHMIGCGFVPSTQKSSQHVLVFYIKQTNLLLDSKRTSPLTMVWLFFLLRLSLTASTIANSSDSLSSQNTLERYIPLWVRLRSAGLQIKQQKK